ncbi:MAG: nicotinate phosphoribosyltransferase [Acidimicrobiia bacterium]
MNSSGLERSSGEGALLVDLYELTMAQLYFTQGIDETPALFEHFFRSYPDYGTHQAGYCIQAGLEGLLDWMDRYRFDAAAIDYLATLADRTGEPLFQPDFLEWLGTAGLDDVRVWSVPEGRVVHAGVTLSVVEGPLAIAQLLETALLNQLSYETLIATKASLVDESARGRPTLEFGLRRGPELGATVGTRAALIGGATTTSNVGAAMLTGVDPAGTHGHSMVQAMMALGMGELGAFRAYADIYQNSCLLLVDTVDTLESGLPNAITVFRELRDRGHEPVGIRLDSGDLAHLAIRSAQQLDAAGFETTTIVLSSGLDELAIWQILTQIEQEADKYGVDAATLIERLAFGVGTKLLTSHGDSSLDSVYKLVAVMVDGAWVPTVKVSEAPDKTVTPGHKRVVRLYDRRGLAAADVMTLESEDLDAQSELTLRHPIRHDLQRTIPRSEIEVIEPLLEPVWAEGRRLVEPEPIEVPRSRRRHDLDRLDPGVRRLMNPHVYHVSLTQQLWDLKQQTVARATES